MQLLRIGRGWVGTAILAVLVGCSSPNQADIRTRKENQSLQAEIDSLRLQNQNDQNLIAGLQARIPTEPTLPPDELSRLVTTHAVRIGRLTGGYVLNPNQPGDQALKVYVEPLDDSGQVIKAAGTITVEAFDLAAKDPRIGKWEFDLQSARANWYGMFLLDYYYAVICPWQTPPAHPDITVKVTFVDELTHLPFTAQKLVHLQLPSPVPEPPTTPQSTK